MKAPPSLLGRKVRIAAPRRWLILLSIGLFLYTLAGAWVAARWQHRAGLPLSAAGFGYGPLIAAIDHTGAYRVADVHYPGIAFSAHRLPLIPATLMALRAVVGDDLARIGLAKALVFNALLGAMLWCVLRRRPHPTVAQLLLLGLPLGLPFWNLTLFEISVEEAYLIPLLGLLMGLLWFGLSPERPSRWAIVAAWLTCAVLPWIKHSMPYWALVAPLMLGLRVQAWKPAVAGVALVALSLLGLAAFNAHVAGRFTVQSSWEGWNLFKGNNPATAATYPYYSLDVLDYTGQVQADRPLRDEWDHNAYFRQRAVDYIREHPRTFLANALRKAWVFFLEIRRTGRSLGQEDDAGALRLVQSAMLLVFRLCFWLAAARALRELGRRSLPWSERAVPLSFLSLVALYAGFHVIGFAYERHVMPLVLPTVLFLVWGSGRDDDEPVATPAPQH